MGTTMNDRSELREFRRWVEGLSWDELQCALEFPIDADNSNEDRLLLLCQMVDGEKCVSDLEAMLDIRQPTLSQQLGVLRTEGVVETRRDGKRIYYRLASDEVLHLLNVLYGMFCPVDLQQAAAEPVLNGAQ